MKVFSLESFPLYGITTVPVSMDITIITKRTTLTKGALSMFLILFDDFIFELRNTPLITRNLRQAGMIQLQVVPTCPVMAPRKCYLLSCKSVPTNGIGLHTNIIQIRYIMMTSNYITMHYEYPNTYRPMCII